jgi:hypothetical protein
LYSHLRFATAASLIVFGGLIGVGVPVLLVSNGERPLVAKADIADSPAAPCKQQTWLQVDRNCLSRRDLPWTVGRGAANGGTVEVKAEPDPAPEQPLGESRHAAAAPQEPVPQEAMSGTPMSPAPGSWEPVPWKSTPPDFVLQGLAPQEPAAQRPASQEPVSKETATQESVTQEPAAQPSPPRRNRTARPAPAPRSAAVEQRVAKSATESQPSQPTAKKPFRSSRIAKRSTNEALNIVRRFGDSPRDIPVSAYAGNGTRVGGRPGLPLDIRPTSIQDVYYYSVPR